MKRTFRSDLMIFLLCVLFLPKIRENYQNNVDCRASIIWLRSQTVSLMTHDSRVIKSPLNQQPTRKQNGETTAIITILAFFLAAFFVIKVK